jgi:hypothetical protein
VRGPKHTSGATGLTSRVVALLLVALVALATAGSAAAVKLGVHVTASASSRTIRAVVHSAPGAVCRMALTPPRRTASFPATRVTEAGTLTGSKRSLTLIWRAPPAAPSGTWVLRVSCTHASGHGQASSRVLLKAARRRRHLCGPRLTVGCEAAHAVLESTPLEATTELGGGSYPPFGQLLVAGSEWFGGHGVNVYSNGCDGCGSSIWSTYGWEWQCVELFERFINTEGWFHGIAGAGITGASELFERVPASAFDKHPNGSGYIPVPGDAVIFAGGFGHVAIVEQVNNGQITVVEQNASPTGRTVLTMNGSTINGVYGHPVIGVLHAKANTSPPAGTHSGGGGGGGGGGAGGGAGGGGAAGPPGTNGYQLAFQANTSELIAFGGDATANTGQGMMPGTSPSVTALAGGGYEMAFQANTGNLIVFGTGGDINTEQGMKAGTSPSIAASPQGGFEVAFQANTGNLYVYNSVTGPANLQQGMDNNTSPAIAALAGGGYETAFQANTTNLIVYGAGGNINTAQGMKPETSPAIAAAPGGGFQAAFQANTGNLYVYNSVTGPANLQQGLDNNTSPSIAP